VADKPRDGWAARRRRARLSCIGPPADPRFSFANERTFLAWNRTALALIAGGLGASELLHFESTGARLSIDVTLIVLGAAVGISGFTRWRASELALRRRVPLPRSRLAPALLAAGAAIAALLSIGLLAFGGMR
jgi:putative membrane protein